MTPSQTASTSLRLLIAEDDPLSREILQELLAPLGLEIDCAEDGQQAIALSQRVRYDLILMDLRMPRVDGLAATQAIRRGVFNANTRVVAVSANSSPTDRQACVLAGMDGFIPKPVDPVSLCDEVAAWLARGPRPA
jgi:CheY-like chemotaxis protein